MSESFEIIYDNKNIDANKESYLRNELTRMSKENTSLRVSHFCLVNNLFQLELNYLYQKLREENKIYEIREDIIVKKQNKDTKDIINSDNTSDKEKTHHKRSKSMIINYNSGASGAVSTNFSNPLVVFKVKTDKKDEDYLIAKNYIKMLRQSEFYMI